MVNYWERDPYFDEAVVLFKAEVLQRNTYRKPTLGFNRDVGCPFVQGTPVVCTDDLLHVYASPLTPDEDTFDAVLLDFMSNDSDYQPDYIHSEHVPDFVARRRDPLMHLVQSWKLVPSNYKETLDAADFSTRYGLATHGDVTSVAELYPSDVPLQFISITHVRNARARSQTHSQ